VTTTHDDSWEAGYRQGRLDAQAEADKADDDDLTTVQALRAWAVEQEGSMSEAAELVEYVLTGKLSV
jgi:hypothetical protein